MRKQKLVNILKWIAVIPTAIVSLLLGSMLANLLFLIQGWFVGVSPDSGFGKINFWIFSSMIGAGASVYYGSKVAPSHRKIVSMVIASLIIILYTLNTVAAISSDDEIFWNILSSIAAVTTAGIVVYNFFEEGDDFNLD